MTCGQSDVRSETLLLVMSGSSMENRSFDLYLKPKDNYNGMGCEMYERKDFKILYSIVIVMCRHFTTRRIYKKSIWKLYTEGLRYRSDFI